MSYELTVVSQSNSIVIYQARAVICQGPAAHQEDSIRGQCLDEIASSGRGRKTAAILQQMKVPPN